jgi:hypothetical protein
MLTMGWQKVDVKLFMRHIFVAPGKGSQLFSAFNTCMLVIAVNHIFSVVALYIDVLAM